ncbi:MAG TPA: GNAT family N-acetyltransferase, partial [Haliangium sp.]|nr:GNAT family N-acetyltransferase [Haliangium sp.]
MPRLSLGDDARLRPLRDQDARSLLEIIDHNRPRLRRWLSWLDDHRDLEAVRSLIANYGRDFSRGHSVRLGIEYRGRIVGAVGLQRINHADRTASLGYWLDCDHERLGLVTRGAAALCRHGVLELGLGRIEIAAATGNTRSIAVAERLGFRFEGVMRCREWLYDHYVD